MKTAFVEILKCNSCGKLELSINNKDGLGERLGGHKCAGSWAVVKKAQITSEHWRKYSSRAPELSK